MTVVGLVNGLYKCGNKTPTQSEKVAKIRQDLDLKTLIQMGRADEHASHMERMQRQRRAAERESY